LPFGNLRGVSRTHAGLIAVLILGAAGLAAVAAWGAGVQGGSCPQYTPPGWVVGVVLGVGVVVLAVVFAGSLSVEDNQFLQRLYVSLGLIETAAAGALIFYLLTKTPASYSCG
jgi:hypothetical protein